MSNRTSNPIAQAPDACDDLLTLDEVKTSLKCSYEHARQLCVNGHLAFVDIGCGKRREYRVRRDDLAEFKRSALAASDRELISIAKQNVRGKLKHEFV